MFLKGDIIICVSDRQDHYLETANVTVGNEYVCAYCFSTQQGVFIRLTDDENQDRPFLANKFIGKDIIQDNKAIKHHLFKTKLQLMLRNG